MKTIKNYIEILYLAYKNHTAYLGDIFGVNITYIIRVMVIVFLYKAIFKYSGGYNSGYNLEEITWALIFTQALAVSKPRITDEVSNDIKTGKISVYLLNPISYVNFKFLETFSRFIYNLTFSLIIGLIIGYFSLGSIKFGISGIIGGLVLIIGGMIITFFGYMSVGLLAFYTEDVEAFRFIYAKIDMILGGNILPIVFLPTILQKIAFLSPFAYTGYASGLIAVRFSIQTFLQYLGFQLFWIIFFVLLCNFIYSRALKKLVINGG